jgi:putative inorganic carbon (hco3(-)) transporter
MLEQSNTCLAVSGIGKEVSSFQLVRPRSREVSIAFGLVIVFLLALYSQSALLVPGLASFAPMNILGGVAIAAVVIQRLVTRRGVDMVWPEGYLLIAFVVSAFLSCLGALWPRYALESTVDLLKYISIYFLIVHTVTSERRLRIVLWTLSLGALFATLGTVRNYWQGNLVEGRAAWIGIFANPNEVAYSLVIMVPIAAYLAVTSSGWERVALWLVIAAYAAAICVTYSRGGMLGLLCVVGLLGLRWRSTPALVVTAFAFALALGFMVYGWTRTESFVSLNSDLNLLQRLATFQGALAMFMENPLSGVGLGCSLIAWPLYAPAGLYTRSWLVIHNTFLQVLCETGLIGFVSFTCCLVVAFSRARALAVSAQDTLADSKRLGSALAVSLWGFVVCGMSGGYILTWFPYILLALVSAAFVIFKTSQQGDQVARLA